jgi:Tfp pilus assembly protein PilO
MNGAVAYRDTGLSSGDLAGAWRQWMRLPLEAWSMRRRAATASLIAIAVFVAGANGWIAADASGVQSRRVLLDEASRHLVEARRAIAQLPALRRAANDDAAARDTIERTSADDLHVISRLATQSDIELLALEPQPVTGAGMNAIRPIHLSARASFPALLGFLRGLPSLPMLVIPGDVSIKRSTGVLVISATLDVFGALRPAATQTGEDVDRQSDDDVLFYDPFSTSDRRAASDGAFLRLVGLLRDDLRRLALLETPDGLAAVARGDDLGEERVADIGAFDVTLSSPDGTHTLALAEVSP